MMVPPLSERPVTEEDEEQFRRESMPRKYTLRQRWADYRAEVRANRPKGAKARVRAWLHVEPFYWGMRAAYVVLVVGAVFAVYINGVANGWWRAWGDKPTVTATTPAARPAPFASSSTDAAPNQNYPKKPRRTPRGARNSQPSTSSTHSPTHGTPETHNHSKTSRNPERTFEKPTFKI